MQIKKRNGKIENSANRNEKERAEVEQLNKTIWQSERYNKIKNKMSSDFTKSIRYAKQPIKWSITNLKSKNSPTKAGWLRNKTWRDND